MHISGETNQLIYNTQNCSLLKINYLLSSVLLQVSFFIKLNPFITIGSPSSPVNSTPCFGFPNIYPKSSFNKSGFPFNASSLAFSTIATTSSSVM